MESDAARTRAFLAARRRVLRELARRHKATAAEVTQLLRQAGRDIAARLADSPSEFESFQLPLIQRQIRQEIDELGRALGGAASRGVTAGWDSGQALLDAPLLAGGVDLAAVLPQIDTRQLFAIRTFMTDKMKDVAGDVAARVNTELGLVLLGARTPGEAVRAIRGHLGGGRGRALTVVRTELGRAFSVAGQERFDQAREILPGLKKQWRRSGKLHSRISHDLADGQIRETDEMFALPGSGTRLKFPRDPRAPARETVNCGCTSLPFMEDWEVMQPGRQPFSDEEIFANPQKRALAGALDGPPDPRAPGLTRIRRLEAMAPAAARRDIAVDLRSEGFARFAARRDRPRDQRAVAVIPDDLIEALGAKARIARLSSATVVKQIDHRREQAFAVEDYARVQDILDRGTAVVSTAQHLEIFGRSDGVVWAAVIKVTKDRSELYLQSLRRSNARQARRRKARLKIVRDGEA